MSDTIVIDIADAINAYVEQRGIYPTTIILNDADLSRMRKAWATCFPMAGPDMAVSGLNVIGSRDVVSGTCALANIIVYGETEPF